MNAHKFVADFGIEKAKAVLEGAPDWANFWISRDQYHCSVMSFPNMTGHYSIDLSELKQVVESLKLVEIHSYEKSKEIVKNAPSDDHFYSWKLGNSGVYDKTVNIGELKQAIADYESIYGGEHV